MPNTKEVNPFSQAYEIAKEIFYYEATNGQAEVNIQKGAEKVLAFAKDYAQSPLEQSEPFGYVFEGKFYKEAPERTFFEGNEPVAVYLSREQ